LPLPPDRRGTLVVPPEAEWTIEAWTADPTGASLQQKRNRRGTLVVPGEREWMIQRQSTDLTSRSLRETVRRRTLVVLPAKHLKSPRWVKAEAFTEKRR